TLKVAKFKKPAEISLVVTGEKRIRTLNKKYRGIDKITDVLSFGNDAADKTVKFVNPPDDILYLGEIFICYSQAVKQAKQKKHSVKKEMAILLIHGILHLLGYDHKEHYEKSEMKIMEVEILKKLSK
ncbi:MAG: rRNA maturation RNase YbeY, partial [Patescibacteria group bacterium]|nr:rRNA maturation RNase YbeY [Patescibacteria group bacterium]